jgi:ABC-type arginine/histidine transport system permease subunit
MGRSGARYGQLGASNVWSGYQTFQAGTEIHRLISLPRAITTAQTLFSADVIILANATGGAFTVTLNTTFGNGQMYIIKKTDASANAVTVTPSAGTIDGAASFALAAQNNSIIVVCDGTNWFVLGKV